MCYWGFLIAWAAGRPQPSKELTMLAKILRVIMGRSPSALESYYQSVLQFTAADVAPS